MQSENCRKVESVNNREDKPQLLMRKSSGFQYICHLNILRKRHQRSHGNEVEISLKEVLMITKWQWFTDSCQKCWWRVALFESSKNWKFILLSRCFQLKMAGIYFCFKWKVCWGKREEFRKMDWCDFKILKWQFKSEVIMGIHSMQ